MASGEDTDVKVIVPTKYKSGDADDDNVKPSIFSRKDNLRASFKDHMSKRYNNKKHHDVVSVLQKLQTSAASMYYIYIIL